MLPSWFAPIVVLAVMPFGALSVRSVWRGESRPSPITWSLWATIPLIAAAAAWLDGAGPAALTIAAGGFGAAIMVAAVLVGPHRHNRWPISRADVLCAALALFAVAGWLVTGSGLAAVIFATVADVFAGLPTVGKVWSHPTSESHWAHSGGAAVALTGILTLQHVSLTTVLFPAYIVVFNVVVVTLIVVGNRAAWAAVAADR